MKITVAICTHDRAGLLAETLESLVAARAPEEASWEVLVVANACSDHTPEVLEEFRGRLPLRAVEEPRRGHSHARNRAVRESRGDYMIWTDDDVRVGRGWLAAYARAFRRWPDAAFFGGPIRPVFRGDSPAWLPEAFDASRLVRAAYAARDLGAEPMAIGDMEHLPYGANMALAGDHQRRLRFDPRLGRSGEDLVGGDELDVMARLLEEGHRGRWVPDAELEHLISPERQTLGYLRRYFRDQGRVAEPLPEDVPVPRLLGRPRWAWRAAIQEELLFRVKRITGGTRDWMPHLIEASFARGALLGPPSESQERG